MNYISVKEVIAKLIRKVRLQDSSYLEDFLLWIPEALDKMRVRAIMDPTYKDLDVCDFILEIPCNCVSIEGIESLVVEGGVHQQRIRESSGLPQLTHQQPYGSKTGSWSGGPRLVEVQKDTVQEDGSTLRKGYYRQYSMPDNTYMVPWNGEDLQQRVSVSKGDLYYILKPGSIHFSFPAGKVRLFYLSQKCDSEGYVLVPSDAYFQAALEWYLLMCMAGSGWKHEIFTYELCERRWLENMDWAVSRMKTPSEDKLERLRTMTSRFLPPTNYYNSFNL